MPSGAIITTLGLAKLASATPLNQLNISALAVGDGNGGYPTLDPSMTSLTNEVWRGTPSPPIRDPNSPNVLIFEAVIPPNVGGFTVREQAIFDDAGDMIAIGQTSVVEKPLPNDATGVILTVRLHIQLDNAGQVDLFFQDDPTISAGNISNANGGSVQDFIDSFALKIFQSLPDGGLTEIQTRTVNANEVYEVRKVSDDSLATIYSNAAGTTEIVQNGTSNVSGSDGVVEFYIADGDYYVEAGGVRSSFDVMSEIQSRQAIEAIYKAQGYNSIFFFKDGFTYAEPNDVGIYEDGTAWTFADADALPVIITAGTVPSAGAGYEQVTAISANAINIEGSSSVQGFRDSQKLNAVVLNADGHLSKVKVVLSEQGEVYNVFNDLDQVVTIYDKNGGNIAQDGVSNVSDNEGIVIFYVPAGNYKLLSTTGEIRFSAGGAKTLRESSCAASSVSAITNTHYSRLDIASKSILNYVIVDIKTKGSNSKLLEVGIYDDTFNLIASSEVREIISAGKNYIALPPTNLSRGEYFVGVTTNSLNAEFLISDYSGGYTSTSVIPLESNPATAISPQCLQTTAVINNYPVIEGDLEIETGRQWRVYGIDETNRTPWGLNTRTFHICKSVDSGGTFIDVMYTPPLGSGIADLIVSNGKIYILMNDMSLYESSDMTASATWDNITCPVNDDLRSPNAVARPYGLAVWNGYVYLGEYTAGNGVTGEVRTTGQSMGPDPVRGPRILKFNLSTRVWSISQEFKKARHIHSFLNAGAAVLWVSVGDALWGDEIGIHRLTSSGLGAGVGGLSGDDTWTQWTSSKAPNTDHYPVDFTVISGGNKTYGGETAIDGVYQTSDRPGKHLLYSGLSGAAGKFNISAQNFATNGVSTETVRSIVADTDTRNLWYFSAETTDPAIYVSPPPYTQSIRVMGFSGGELNNLFRSVYSNGYIMMFNIRFKVSRFVGQ